MPAETLTKEDLAELDEGVRARRPEALAALQKLVDSPPSDPFLRAAVVAQLGAVEGESSERLLISVLSRDDSDVVRAKACGALLRVGSPLALETLARLATEGPEALRTIAGFAHVVVSHRLRRPSPFLRLPGPSDLTLPTGNAVPFTSRELSDGRRRELETSLEASRLRLGQYSRAPLEVACARNTWALVLHEDVAAAGLSAVLQKAPAVLGVVARRSEEHERWSIGRILLGGPLEGDGFYVTVHRRDGVTDLAGTGRLPDRVVDLVAVRRPGGVPVSVRAYWHGGQAVISGISAVDRLPARAPLARRPDREASEHAGQ